MKAALRRSLFCLGRFLGFPEILDLLDFLDLLEILENPPAASPNVSD